VHPNVVGNAPGPIHGEAHAAGQPTVGK
jgi:hypothetical protein